MKTIDLRSDTVTKPTEAMRQAMLDAEVGDDVYGEDPTVNRLQKLAAEISGKEAGLFVPTGTQSNLLAILSHCQRGEEFIAGQQAHCYRYEGGGAAVFGGVQPQPIDFEVDGRLDLYKVAEMIKPDDSHFAITRLLCLENTQSGKVLSLDYQAEAAAFGREKDLKLHLDGARVFNAAVKQQVPISEITRHYDSVSFCLSKGLGTPVGSVLVGSHELIERAHRWRKMAGGGMRQAGILAAAGVYALQHHVVRLAEDHHNARALAEGLSTIDGLDVELDTVETNMVFVTSDRETQPRLVETLKERGILVGGYGQLRLVTHHDIDAEDIPVVVEAFQKAVVSCKL
ncbi:low-specificity L-threonine aldolase [Deltaproteobacteria bacterium IMCC39524]|nr:low-specificity L-threonine aldolase [Deltaproteobacteria bacterium IMCC39524]